MAIIFMHIPKTGGTYVDSFLQAQPNIKSFPDRGSVDLLHETFSIIDSNNYQNIPIYIGGHININMIDECIRYHYLQNPSQYSLVSLIRHPLERFISATNYLIEILSRGLDFFLLHPLPSRIYIVQSYFLLDSRFNQDFRHLYDMESNNYLAKYLVPQVTLSYIKKQNIEISECVEILLKILSNYDFLRTLENSGPELLNKYICEKFSIEQETITEPNRNESNNYVHFDQLLKNGFLDYNRENSRIDSLLYLMVYKGMSSVDILKSMTWKEITEEVEQLFFRHSKYVSRPVLDIPYSATKCIEDILCLDYYYLK